MNALLTAIVTWLSINFSLPATYDHPQVTLMPPAQITTLRYGIDRPPDGRAVVGRMTIGLAPSFCPPNGPAGVRPSSRYWSTRWCITSRIRRD